MSKVDNFEIEYDFKNAVKDIEDKGIDWKLTPIWFVWVMKTSTNGVPRIDLRAVDDTLELAKMHVAIIKRDELDANAVYIEERVINHLYGQRDVTWAFKMSGSSKNVWHREE